MKFYSSFKTLASYTVVVLFSVGFSYCTGEQVRGYDGKTQFELFKPDTAPYVVADSLWNVDSLGNHRAIVNVKDPSQDAVLVLLPWRRPDRRPETKRIVVVDHKTGRKVKNVHAFKVTNEEGVIAFEPENGSQEYAVYYLPYKFREKWGDARYGKPWNDYLDTSSYALTDNKWLTEMKANKNNLPVAGLKRFESRTEFDFFTPMGVIATQEEEDLIKEGHKEKSFIIFPEDRAYPIRLPDQLPWKWTTHGPSDSFTGYASRNEYYTWQIGVWAPFEDVSNIAVSFSDFSGKSATIKKEEITCFNQEGTNWDGKPVRFRVNLKKGGVQAMWCGIQIPEKAAPGKYTGTATVSADGMPSQTVQVVIHVDDNVLSDRGDNDLWRHSRLRWLNSTIGMDSLPVAPYQPVTLSDGLIEATGKQVQVGENGLLQFISVNNKQVLLQPVEFRVVADGKIIPVRGNNAIVKKVSDGLVQWSASAEEDGIWFICNASMEYDGYIRYNIKIVPDKPVSIQDIQLTTSYTAAAAPYFMGCGYNGGLTPGKYRWDWKGPWDSYWIGSDKAGLHVEFRGGDYHGPLLNDYKPKAPASWSNDGKGSIEVKRNSDHTVDVTASSGARSLTHLDTLDFEFGLLITPVKEVNPAKHFSERYFHGDPGSFDKAALEEANIANIHHSGALNPIINYPFLIKDALTGYIDKQHQENRKVKLYYTIRELSNYAAEIFALKSLNHEIFVSGVGQGLPWHMEHLIDDYKPAWYTELPNQASDAALVLNGFSRWINYYLEGLRWMYENYEIDGIYMDDVSFDRSVMKRMRKIAARYRPGALIDLHSNTAYSKDPMNQYTDFFPYVDRLWFGESFKYNEMSPDEWLVTFSGIPFGQMSEMLQDGGNRYLGMVYGATARHSWGDFSPAPVWKLWKSFGIEDAKMIGYWSNDRIVETTHPNVKATAYVKDEKVLISLGNFDTNNVTVKLMIDWDKLGVDASGYNLVAPEVSGFQPAGRFSPGDEIPVKAKEGWLLILEKTN
ncbi:MAG: hypothetical protein KIT80_04830 [Chitinophagaceae bacterium]|nr:hypothetical protein [Chitinophagaceae bacterium]MCW5926217.1 hypothetical protein [Chitinophagaceae bacterium]